MIPDCKYHNPDPDYIRRLIRDAGMTQNKACAKIGISLRSLHDYINPKHPSKIPYSVQFCLEELGRQCGNK